MTVHYVGVMEWKGDAMTMPEKVCEIRYCWCVDEREMKIFYGVTICRK